MKSKRTKSKKLTAEDILVVLERQKFYDFYAVEFDDYIVESPDEEKRRKILEKIEQLFRL